MLHVPSMEGLGVWWKERNFTLDLHGNVEGKLGHANRTTRVSSTLLTKDSKYELSEAVYDRGLSIEPRCRVHHAEHSGPTGDALQASEFALEAAENGKAGKASRHEGLFLRNLSSDLAKRLGERAVRIGGSVARDESPIANHAHPGKRKRDPRREPQWLRYDVAECVQAGFDG